MTDQTKRTVVVTGGSRGIGRVICCELATPGTTIYFNYFNPGDPEGEAAAAAETEKMVTELGATAKSSAVDVSSTEDVAAFFGGILNDTGRIDVLVNNAGITRDGLLVRMKESAWDMVMEINLKGAFRCIKLAGKAMMKQRSGRIVNIASISGVWGPSRPGELRRFQGRADRAHKSQCTGTCSPGGHRERRRTGIHHHRYDGDAFRGCQSGLPGPDSPGPRRDT